jgi:hypothetical protein
MPDLGPVRVKRSDPHLHRAYLGRVKIDVERNCRATPGSRNGDARQVDRGELTRRILVLGRDEFRTPAFDAVW